MTQFVCWVVFPLVLGILTLGCGLLLEAATGFALPEGLHMPAGLAVMIVAGEVTTRSGIPKLTMPVAVVFALFGWAAGRPWQNPRRVANWALLAASGVYFIYLAPVLFTGEPTWTGYIKLDDTSTWFGFTDRLLGHGHSLAGLSHSSYEVLLHVNQLYPVGDFIPWGIGHQIVGQDLA